MKLAFLLLATSAVSFPLKSPVQELFVSPGLVTLEYSSHDLVSEAENLSVEAYNKLPEVDTDVLQSLVAEKDLRLRAEQLFKFAEYSIEEHGHPTRVIGSRGHWATVGYIMTELRKLGGYYNISTQTFPTVLGKVKSVSLLIDGVQPKSLSSFSLTPSTKDSNPVHGNLVLVSNNGCSLDDFPKHTKGNIALIKRGECSFGAKSLNGGISGAVGVIIYDKTVLHGTLETPIDGQVAAVSIDENDAKPYIDKLTKDPTAIIETTLYVDASIDRINSQNVIAETVFGDHDNVVSLGAHSDSVVEGPGINDDGSGLISLLEVAKHLSKFKTNNAVRFSWWTAEEEGLLGSTHFANSLNFEENIKTRLFMDYDMLASPNFEYQVYDANNEDHPNGSGTLKDLYVDWYIAKGLNYTFIPFDGRSDYVGFIDNGIPAGGIASGAEGVKTKEGAAKFGGKAGEWFDSCYHQLCDGLDNVNYETWVINTQLIAHSVATYGKSFDGFPKRDIKLTKSSDNKFIYRGSFAIM